MNSTTGLLPHPPLPPQEKKIGTVKRVGPIATFAPPSPSLATLHRKVDAENSQPISLSPLETIMLGSLIPCVISQSWLAHVPFCRLAMYSRFAAPANLRLGQGQGQGQGPTNNNNNALLTNFGLSCRCRKFFVDQHRLSTQVGAKTCKEEKKMRTQRRARSA